MLTLILAAIVISVLFYFLVNWVSIKLAGIKATFLTTAKITSIVVLFQVILIIPWLVTSNNVLGAILSLLSLIGSVILWCRLLNHYCQTSLGKSIGALLLSYAFSSIAGVILVISALGFVQAFSISGPTMSPTLNQGDKVLVYKFDTSYGLNDVVIYHVAANGKPVTGVGRILGTPGQTVNTEKGYVNSNYQLVQATSYSLQSDEYYIVGDNQSAAQPFIVKANDIRGVVGPTLTRAK